MGVLTRDDIIKAKDIEQELVEVPEWGGSVYVQGMTGLQRGMFEDYILATKTEDTRRNRAKFRAQLLVLCIVDADGNPLFREEDVDALSEKSAAPLDRLYDKVQKLSGFRKEDVDEITKNSSIGQKEDSTTDSPSL